MQRLEGLMRKAIQEYKMIELGDRICVGVSGGKDSVALTVGLAHLRRYMKIPFEVIAVSLDPQFSGKATDYAPLESSSPSWRCPSRSGGPTSGPSCLMYARNPTPAPSAPRCAAVFCTTPPRSGLQQGALGHHLDDAIETFYMNLWGEGRLGCFSPVTYSSPQGSDHDPAHDPCHRKRRAPRSEA